MMDVRFTFLEESALLDWKGHSADSTYSYLWRRLKDIIYQTRPITRENMIDRTQIAVNMISRAEIEILVSSTNKGLF